MTAFRYLTDEVVEAGDVLYASATGRCWRVLAAREVQRRTPTRWRYTWACTIEPLPDYPPDADSSLLSGDGPTTHVFVRHTRANRLARE